MYSGFVRAFSLGTDGIDESQPKQNVRGTK